MRLASACGVPRGVRPLETRSLCALYEIVRRHGGRTPWSACRDPGRSRAGLTAPTRKNAPLSDMEVLDQSLDPMWVCVLERGPLS
jgi:hypothetical protein